MANDVEAAAIHIKLTVAEFLSGVVKATELPDPTRVELAQYEEAWVTLPLKLMLLVAQHVPA